MSARLLLALVYVALLAGCNHGKPGDGLPRPGVAEVPDDAAAPDLPEGLSADALEADLAPDPTQPRDAAGGARAWMPAPFFGRVFVTRGRDSVVLHLPALAEAKDFRAFVLTEATSVSAKWSGEAVDGADIHCAGFEQHNSPVAEPVPVPKIELTGLTGKATVVIEALDAPCPFPGVIGQTHADIKVNNNEVPEQDRVTFSFFTPAEIRARYGSLIINGHGPATTLAQPAAPNAPRVLARTTVVVSPLGYAEPPPTTFFDDFADPAATPAFVSAVTEDGGRSQRGKVYQNDRWSFYTFGAERADIFIDRGQLHTVLADWAQDIFSTNVAYPRRAVQLSDNGYLHVTFDVASNSTARRYWWLVLCGADRAGETLDASGLLTSPIVQTAFFYQPDGRNPSLAGWNCLQVFPRDGSPFPLGSDDVKPEADVRVMVNRANAPLRENVVNVSPAQYNQQFVPPGWFRQQDSAGNLGAPMLDDQMLIAPRTRYDFYIRRNRVIMLVNGQQRLCNDFPGVPLTMAEGALGFGQVLYHSTAERLEFSRSYWDRTGQRYYLNNTPYVDARQWDNLGYSENAGEPSGFDPSQCHVHQ